eukprot:GHVU01171612.1.p1 GENE.GHVU01171612.1~~GHVU01171612.1.p1  ORF type:complete len:499 (+),score=35.82 GHVU01171612.1:29-1498(+)
MALHATDTPYRFILLFFNCLLTFGSYFCFDMPSVLQDKFQANITCIKGNVTTNDCDGLGMSGDEYNLLYAIYAWTNAVVVIGAGFLIDKMGNKVGVFLFSGLCVLGSSTFALGIFFKGTSALLPIMLIGRLLFGAGNGSLTVVQNRITAFWFRDKELALAMGITLAFSRLGSVLNFLLTQNFANTVGLTWTLWGGAILCGVGFISAIIVTSLDVMGVKQLGLQDNIKMASKRVRLQDIRHLNIQFWMLALTIMFFYNGIFPFVADASKFIQDKYYPEFNTTAPYIAGATYDVSMVLAPFLGGIIDVFGMRGWLALSCALGTLPVFGLLAFSSVYPLICTLWLGVTYSFAAASMWPSIPLVVPDSVLGTAWGLTTSLQMVGIGICNLVVGAILGKNQDLNRADTLERWKYVMIFLLANTILCVVAALVVNVIDKKQGGVLNESRRQKEARQLHSSAYEPQSSAAGTPDSDDMPTETDALLGNQHSINRPA